MRLSERIERLEQAGGLEPQTLIVCWCRPGETDRELTRLRQGYAMGDSLREWVREAGETEQEFRDRAAAEATRGVNGLAVLFAQG